VTPPAVGDAADPIAVRLAAFAIEPHADIVPESLRSTASLHLLDAVGCGLAAVGMDAGSYATDVARSQGGHPQASILGALERVPAPLAALANGTRCHALDFDDTHEQGICHSSTVLAPTVLAVGQATRANGATVLDAFVLGTEVALRIAAASAEALYTRGFHPTSVCGAFGAAAAASRLLGLDQDQTTNALGIVGSFASGLFEYLSDGSATKPMHAGWAAHAGIHAAQLAAAGGSGPATVIEGRFGLLASHAGDVSHPDAICGDLGDRWETAAVSIKPFPACHFAHASTWAAGALADEHGLSPGEITEIIVRIPPPGAPLVLEPAAGKATPQTPYDAKFSLPFIVAHRLVHGRVDLRSFSPDQIRDPEVLELARRVQGERLPERGPWSRFAGGALIRTADGRSFDGFLKHPPGSPGNPLSDAWILTKFRSNAELSLSAEDTRELANSLLSLAKSSSLDRIGELVGNARQGADR
jgi:2-methylcitrate dehydratase PrpD